MRAIKRIYWQLREQALAAARRVPGQLRDLRLAQARRAHRARAAIGARIHARELRALRASLGAGRGATGARPLVAISLVEHMGDIVTAEPISRVVRRLHPEAFVVWVVRAPYAELVVNNPSVDRTLVVSCLTEWVELRQGALFDLIFDLHLRLRVCPVCRVPLEKPEGDQRITGENYFDFGNLLAVECQNAGLAVFDDKPRVHIPQSALRVVDALCLPGSFVVIHCRSNELSRDWEEGKWIHFAKELGERSIHCVEVGTVPVLSEENLPHYTNLCNRLTILETAEVIRRATMFVGVDSGPAHLANAVDTFGIVLMGHYRAFRKAMPYCGRYGSGENAEVIFAEGPAATAPVDEIVAATKKHWARLNSPQESKAPRTCECNGR